MASDHVNEIMCRDNVGVGVCICIFVCNPSVALHWNLLLLCNLMVTLLE